VTFTRGRQSIGGLCDRRVKPLGAQAVIPEAEPVIDDDNLIEAAALRLVAGDRIAPVGLDQVAVGEAVALFALLVVLDVIVEPAAVELPLLDLVVVLGQDVGLKAQFLGRPDIVQCHKLAIDQPQWVLVLEPDVLLALTGGQRSGKAGCKLQLVVEPAPGDVFAADHLIGLQKLAGRASVLA
jgi:hypothetical protein